MIKRPTSLFSFLLIFSVFLSCPVAATQLQKKNGVVRFSYEPVTLPGNESMGLAGVSYLFDVGKAGYVGFTGFSAVTGQRGGFFTGGLQTGLRHHFNDRWLIDSGLFVGGGGGGAAPQGGGLMLRPHVGVLYDLGASRLGLGYSGVIYPNGSIDSRQWYLSLETPFTLFLADTSASEMRVPTDSAVRLAPIEVATVLRQYTPQAGSLDTSSLPLTTPTHLFGISLRQYRGEYMPRWFTLKEIAGSAGGDTDGYAEILGGVGYQSGLGRSKAFWETTLAIGAGGGGRVDTGGGLIVRAEAGLGYRLSSALSARMGLGYMDALDGHYQAQTLTAQLGYTWRHAGAYDYGEAVLPGDTLHTVRWHLHAVNQLYATPAWKGAPRGDHISLMGIKVDWMASPNTYLTGQGLAAYDGGAGGYAVGLLGAGRNIALGKNSKWSASIELAMGAAGGGSLDVGDGIVVQPGIGLNYRPGRNLEFSLDYSNIKALTGGLNSAVYEIGISYQFGTAGKYYGNTQDPG